MGLCVVGACRKLTPTLCSLAHCLALLAFNVMTFDTLLGVQRRMATLHGADALVTNVRL